MTDEFTEHLCAMRRTEVHVSGSWEFLSDGVEKTYDVLATDEQQRHSKWIAKKRSKQVDAEERGRKKKGTGQPLEVP